MKREKIASFAAVLLMACGGSSTDTGEAPGSPTPAPPPAPTASPAPPESIGSCNYQNPFSGLFECKHYTGDGWNSADAGADCDEGPVGSPGEFFPGENCDVAPTLGSCPVEGAEAREYVIEIAGEQGRDCAASAQACTGFLGGTFYASQNCTGYDLPPMSAGGGESTTFQWPTQTCKPALPGEPEGLSDGEVCTWNLISGSTEEGRRFADYGDCEMIYTNRPYYPLGPWANPPENDARYEDASWLSEAEWVRSQVVSSACVCCHSADSPDGPARWSVDAGPLWTDTMSPEAIALFAGITDSSVLGAFPPEDNNGFDRVNSAFPSTDPDRMRAFFLGELERRGITQEFLDGLEDVGGPLILQRDYEPSECGEGEGVDADGQLTWKGGAARYLYVLESGSANPGIPPNLDLPEGTLWRIDVSWDSDPFESGVGYGTNPGASFQRFPAAAAPASLEPGREYYLYVLRDVAIPLARCLFTAP